MKWVHAGACDCRDRTHASVPLCWHDWAMVSSYERNGILQTGRLMERSGMDRMTRVNRSGDRGRIEVGVSWMRVMCMGQTWIVPGGDGVTRCERSARLGTLCIAIVESATQLAGRRQRCRNQKWRLWGGKGQWAPCLWKMTCAR